MVGYVTLGTNDLDRAIEFYDALFEAIGGKQIMNIGRMVMWGEEMGQGMVALCKPFDGEAASVGNGVMVALNLGSKDRVNAFYEKALELGGTSEGEPGERMQGFYGAYFRDLDGNKFCGFVLGG